MLVKMRAEISGVRDGQPWPPVGGTVEIPDDEAMLMLRNGTAEPVFDPDARVERAVAPDAEQREAPMSARDALVPTTRRKKS